MYSLTIEDNNGQIAEQFSFDHGSYVIGRQENCDIVLPSSSVSRKHANIFVEDGRCYIEDLNSANGVTVDGQRVVKQRHLGTASQIRIGDYYLYLEYQADDDLDDQNIRQTMFIGDDDADHNKLVRINDEFAGEEFTLSEVENTIGRTDDNFILLSDPSISRQHAMISRDGDDYQLVDLGSSNGTRVNGDEVLEPHSLTPGDVVEFGNVEFVFARGDQEVDPSEYETSGLDSDTLLLASVVAVVLFVGLAAGGLLVYVFGFSSLNQQEATANQASSKSIQSQVDMLMEEGESELERQNWDAAIQKFNEILALSPNHERAKKLREQARTEKEAKKLLEKGVELSTDGKHQKALEVLGKIPEGTAAYESSRETISHVRKTVAFDLRTEAEQLVEKGGKSNLESAREKLERAVSLDEEDEKAEKLLDDVRQRLDE